MAMSMDFDSGDPHQNLANAIILEACQEWRSIAAYLKKHPTTPEMEEEYRQWLNYKRRVIRRWKRVKQKEAARRRAYGGHKRETDWRKVEVRVPKKVKRSVPCTDEMIYVAKVHMKRDELKDLEAWFRSRAFEILSEVDPEYILEHLRKEMNDAK